MKQILTFAVLSIGAGVASAGAPGEPKPLEGVGLILGCGCCFGPFGLLVAAVFGPRWVGYLIRRSAATDDTK